jgi:small conductance mechanosensitive channel
MDISNLFAKVYELLTVYGLKAVNATVMFVTGCWVKMLISNLIKKNMTKTSTDETQEKFLGSLSYTAFRPLSSLPP